MIPPRFLEGTPSEAMPSAAQWWPVLYSPEPATGERITVGIALRGNGGDTHTRWLRAFDRLRTVFGEQAARQLPFLLRHADQLVSQSESPDTPHLHFGEARELWHGDLEKAADELFQRFVPLARQFKPNASPVAVQNRSLQRSVYDLLKRCHDPSAADLIPQNPMLSSREDVGRKLYVPIQARDRFATLVSAQASKPGTIDSNVYPAVAQLNAAANIHRIGRRAVFLLRPEEGSLPDAQYDKIDEHIHRTVYILKNEGVTVLPEISVQHIVDELREWAAR